MAIKRVCSDCGKKFQNLKRKCTCGSENVVKSPTDITPKMKLPIDVNDIIVKAKNQEFKPEIKMVESILLNPNSYKNIEMILTELKTIAGNDF